MKRLYKAVVCACALLTIGACAPAYAATPGATCSWAIPIEKEADQTFTYVVDKASISSPKEVWFSAMTFDLPLAVTFEPDGGESASAPEVEMDFSCISGYYENEILCNMFCKTGGNSGVDVKLPYKATLSSKKLDDGRFVYYLQLGERYRNLLLQMGISENLKVVVRVIFKSPGILSLAPDDFFTNCMDGPKFMQVGDTVEVKAKDAQRHVVVPYVQWQEDTIVYTWKGSKPCTLQVAATCDFDPTETDIHGILVQNDPIQPGESLKVKAEDIYKWVHNAEYPPQAGMYFAKIYSESDGVMKVTKAPQAVPDGGAVLMRLGTSYALDANSKAIYAIPRSWNVDIICSSPTIHLFTMEISKSASFNEGDILATYPFKLSENGRWVGLIGDELKTTLWNKIAGSQPYLYVRFICTEATSITADRWDISDCYKNTMDFTVEPNQTINPKSGSKQAYRFSYSQWRDGNMTIEFWNNSEQAIAEVYFADTCGMNRDNEGASYWLLYKSVVNSQKQLEISAEDIKSWGDKLDTEGCFYGLFYATASGKRNFTFTTNAPEDADPTYPTTTITVACDENKQPYVQVSKVQTITVRDESGTVVKTISDAQPETKYPLSELSVGKYTLEGEEEKIAVNL